MSRAIDFGYETVFFVRAGEQASATEVDGRCVSGRAWNIVSAFELRVWRPSQNTPDFDVGKWNQVCLVMASKVERRMAGLFNVNAAGKCYLLPSISFCLYPG